ncbi:MAG: CIA30 family protein [Bacteroidota bacterium]
MIHLILTLAMLLHTHDDVKQAPSTSTSMLLFDFQTTGPTEWEIENDGVMGGRSQGFVEIQDGMLVFTGEVVTQGGGFTSTRAWHDVDLSGFDGLELRVRGGGRTFEVDVDEGLRDRGREVNRRGAFPTTDEWAVVRVPFALLRDTAHGNPVDVPPLDLSAIVSIGIYIVDGQDGPFQLEIDEISAYRAD